jgi:uncharacterized protein
VFAGRMRDRIVGRYGADSVFIDIDNIPVGRDFRQHIKGVLSECDVVIVVVGPKWLGAGDGGDARIFEKTDPVRIEVETALRNGVPVIPVLVGDTQMPAPTQLPEALTDFAFINAATVDTGRDFHPHMERLLRGIDEILEGKKGKADDNSRTQIVPEKWSNSSTRRTLLATCLLLGVGLAIAVVVQSNFTGAPLWPQQSNATEERYKVQAQAVTPIAPPASQANEVRPQSPPVPQNEEKIVIRAAPMTRQALNPPAPAAFTDPPNAVVTARPGPSFDCQRANKLVEQTICGNVVLAKKDRTLSDLYVFLKTRLPSVDRPGFVSAQVAWLAARNQCERNPKLTDCINDAYDTRIAELKTGPSFDCQIDKAPVEQAICSDMLLAAMDQRLSDLYQAVRRKKPPEVRQSLLDTQRQWLRQRSQCSGASISSCIEQQFDRRFIELDGAASR